MQTEKIFFSRFCCKLVTFFAFFQLFCKKRWSKYTTPASRLTLIDDLTDGIVAGRDFHLSPKKPMGAYLQPTQLILTGLGIETTKKCSIKNPLFEFKRKTYLVVE